MFVVAILKQKGGVGKSTLSSNLGAQLARRGHSVVLIDADPQGTLTEATLGLYLAEHTGDYEGTAEILGYGATPTERRTIAQVAIPSEDFDLRVVPSNYTRLIHQETALRADSVEGNLALMDALARADGVADFVIYDGPPNFGPLMVNGAVAADAVIVPLDSAGEANHALGLLMATFLKYQRIRGGPVPVLAGVLTKFNERAREDQMIRAETKRATMPTQETPFFPNVLTVRMTTGFKRAFNQHKPLHKVIAKKNESEEKAVAEVDALVDVVVEASKRAAAGTAA